MLLRLSLLSLGTVLTAVTVFGAAPNANVGFEALHGVQGNIDEIDTAFAHLEDIVDLNQPRSNARSRVPPMSDHYEAYRVTSLGQGRHLETAPALTRGSSSSMGDAAAAVQRQRFVPSYSPSNMFPPLHPSLDVRFPVPSNFIYDASKINFVNELAKYWRSSISENPRHVRQTMRQLYLSNFQQRAEEMWRDYQGEVKRIQYERTGDFFLTHHPWHQWTEKQSQNIVVWSFTPNAQTATALGVFSWNEKLWERLSPPSQSHLITIYKPIMEPDGTKYFVRSVPS